MLKPVAYSFMQGKEKPGRKNYIFPAYDANSMEKERHLWFLLEKELHTDCCSV